MPTGERRGEAGYSLAVLIGILTVIAILLGAALPHWGARVQRDREAELVARGLQYAEAIRVFQRRFGRLPTRLEELVELEPRSIRRLWRNPFARGEGAGWAVLVEGPGAELLAIDPATGALLSGAVPADPDADAPEAAGPGVEAPIHGVRSVPRGEAYRSFFDSQDYGDWEFTVERWVAATGATGPDGTLRRADYDAIGRPFAYPPPGGIPGAPAAPGGGAGAGGPAPELPGGPPPDDSEEGAS